MKLLRLTSGLLLICIATTSWAINITVSVTPNKVQVGSTFTVVWEIHGRYYGSPNFSPLYRHFDVLHKQHRYQYNSATRSMHSQWRLILKAKRVGLFKIPRIRFGRYHAQEFTIRVQKAVAGTGKKPGNVQKPEDSKHVFVKLEILPKKVYVQQEVVVKLRIFTTRNIRAYLRGISRPEIETGDAVIKSLHSNTDYNYQLNGVTYRVFERHFVLYPQKAGKLKLKPFKTILSIYGNRRRWLNYSNPAYTYSHRYRYSRHYRSRVTRETKPVTIDVEPAPKNRPGKKWLPARNLRITDSWSNNQNSIRVGEPLTRTITIEADGVIPENLPSLGSQALPGMKHYSDNAVLRSSKRHDRTGMVGKRIEKIAMIPTKPGEFKVPGVTLVWWNTQTSRFETATLASRTIKVLPGTGINRTVTPPVTPSTSSVLPGIGRTGEGSQSEAGTSGVWLWVSIATAIGWLLTLLFWWYNVRQRREQTELVIRQQAEALEQHDRGLLRQVQQACTQNLAQEARQAIIAWAHSVWHSGKRMTLEDVVEKLDDSDFAREVQALDDSLYGSHATQAQWRGEALWKIFNRLQATVSRASSGKQDDLVALNRIQ